MWTLHNLDVDIHLREPVSTIFLKIRTYRRIWEQLASIERFTNLTAIMGSKARTTQGVQLTDGEKPVLR
ncbi:hypothetical protein PSEUDO8BK_10654 [Pseudomonas sp. 8BK]|nr:hypothetical protein PSEUDO8BK_10654 [Pseudomonas sp. 8BK]